MSFSETVETFDKNGERVLIYNSFNDDTTEEEEYDEYSFEYVEILKLSKESKICDDCNKKLTKGFFKCKNSKKIICSDCHCDFILDNIDLK